MLRQVICFVTWWVDSSIISLDSNLTSNIIRETIKVEKKEMVQDRILRHSRINSTLRRWIVLLDKSKLSTTKKWLIKKKHLTISTLKFNFVKRTSSMLYPVKRHLKSCSPNNTRGVERHRNPISLSRQDISSKTR